MSNLEVWLEFKFEDNISIKVEITKEWVLSKAKYNDDNLINVADEQIELYKKIAKKHGIKLNSILGTDIEILLDGKNIKGIINNI